jgi:amidophosphoribosyltransferase
MCAVRDPNGFRPLCIGRLKGRGIDGSDGYCVASETCALDLC